MNKTIIIILLTILIFSCTNKNQSENTIARLEILRVENDSLRKIVDGIKNKYVFDSISFREIPNAKNTYKLNTSYELELIVVGYSPASNYFVKYDSIVNDKMINPDTLIESNGGFKLKVPLDKKKNPIWIDMNINNKYGKTKKGTLYDVIEVRE